MVRLRHFHQRTRPFRRGGLWLLALAGVLLAAPPADAARTPAQLAAGIGFCALWPWVADRWRQLGPRGDALGFEMGSFVAECALAALVLGWMSLPPFPAFAGTVCLLGGATALSGWRLLLPAAAAVVVGGAAGASLSPRLTAASTAGADLVAGLLMLTYVLALGEISFRQAQRLAVQRQGLAEKSAALGRINDRLQRYLPPSLRDRVKRAPEQPCRWERRWLTVVFVDLVGFTALSERLEAERLAAMLDDYLAALIPAAERRGGEVSKLLGDGMLVVFGLSADDDRRRAVDSALAFCMELPARLAALAGVWRARGEPVSLRMRAGIASGFCTLGDRGGAGRLDFTLIGPAVNLASRLQVHAAIDGVLMDEASAALAETNHRLEGPRSLDVKGLGPTLAYAPFDPTAPSAMVPAPARSSAH